MPIVIHQYAFIQWTAFWYQAYLPYHSATDLLFLYVKKIRKFLRFQSFFCLFSLRLTVEKIWDLNRCFQTGQTYISM